METSIHWVAKDLWATRKFGLAAIAGYRADLLDDLGAIGEGEGRKVDRASAFRPLPSAAKKAKNR